MRSFLVRACAATFAAALVIPVTLVAQDTDARLESLKTEALALVEGRAKLVQEIVDHLFSFGELGM